jgi:Uma2 family endonuclease
MGSVITPQRCRPAERAVELFNGDRLTQPEFHRRYEAQPADDRFELIGGVVYMASPLGLPHGTCHTRLNLVLSLYQAATLGTEHADNTTVILGEESEPQPDSLLMILPEYGGQTRLHRKKYILGAPEFVAEVAHSTRAIDLNQKKVDYQRGGVKEYLVVCLEEEELHWFSFKPRKRLAPDSRGIYRSHVFPGLWLDGPALLARNSSRLLHTLEQGLATQEHAAFVRRLRGRRAGPG